MDSWGRSREVEKPKGKREIVRERKADAIVHASKCEGLAATLRAFHGHDTPASVALDKACDFAPRSGTC